MLILDPLHCRVKRYLPQVRRRPKGSRGPFFEITAIFSYDKNVGNGPECSVCVCCDGDARMENKLVCSSDSGARWPSSSACESSDLHVNSDGGCSCDCAGSWGECWTEYFLCCIWWAWRCVISSHHLFSLSQLHNNSRGYCCPICRPECSQTIVEWRVIQSKELRRIFEESIFGHWWRYAW